MDYFGISISLANWSHGIGSDEQVNAADQVTLGATLPLEHKNKVGESENWEAYTDAQRQTYRDLCRILCETYPTIRNIIGHDDISVGRKVDPGPDFQETMEETRNDLSADGYLDLLGERGRSNARIRAPRGQSKVRVRRHYDSDSGSVELPKGERVHILSRTYRYIPDGVDARGKPKSKAILGDYYAISRDGEKLYGFVPMANVRKPFWVFSRII